MTELIVGVLLAGVKLFFQLFAAKEEQKKRIAKLIVEWMKVMSKEFQASAEVSEAFEKMWEDSFNTPWKETGIQTLERHR